MKKEVEFDSKLLDDTIQEILDNHKKKLNEIKEMDEHLKIIDKISKGEIK